MTSLNIHSTEIEPTGAKSSKVWEGKVEEQNASLSIS